MNNEYETFTLINGMRVMYIKNDTNLSSIQVCTKVRIIFNIRTLVHTWIELKLVRLTSLKNYTEHLII